MLFACPMARPAFAKCGSNFSRDVLAEHPADRSDPTTSPPFHSPNGDGKVIREIPRLRLIPGATLDPAKFETGYADHGNRVLGKHSIGIQQDGVIPAGVKFQVSLPTPIAPAYNNMVPSDRPALPASFNAAFHWRGREDHVLAAS